MLVRRTLSSANPSPKKLIADSAASVEQFLETRPVRRHVGVARAGRLRAPTPVQAGLIPRALAGVDVMGQARTGTGKTAAFVIPILERLERSKKGAPPQALVLVPTRELAVQVRDECVKLAHGRRVHCVAVYGGKPIREQIGKLQRAPTSSSARPAACST